MHLGCGTLEEWRRDDKVEFGDAVLQLCEEYRKEDWENLAHLVAGSAAARLS